MIKRLSKTKKSKQGAILVIVVLILALAMIFISAAMMLTQATRGRLYETTMSSQARLTVTAASEVFLEALQTQEITDDQIDKMLSNTPARHTNNSDKIKMIIPGVPGMSNSDKNCTYLDLYYPDTSDKDYVNADFTTVIGDQVENIRLVLHVKHRDPSYGGRFKNQIDIAGSVTTSQVRFDQGVGMVNPALGTVDDNTILFRGNAREQTSNAVFYSDIVFAEGATGRFGGGNAYYGNMVFLDNAYMSGSASVKAITGDMYFIGKTHNDAGFKWENDNIWSSVSSKNFIFSGRTVQEDNDKDQNQKIKDLVTASGKNCYFVGNSSGTIVAKNSKGSYNVTNAGSTLPDSLKNKLSVYKSYDYGKISDPFPSNIVTDVFMDMNTDGKTTIVSADEGVKLDYDTYSADGKTFYPKQTKIPKNAEYVTHPVTKTYPEWLLTEDGKVPADKIISLEDVSKLDGGSFDKDGNSTNRIISLAPGYYQFTSGTTCNSADGKPYVFAIDGSKASSYRFYFKSGQYYINNTVFALYSVQNDPAPVLFIMEPGAKIEFSGANYRKTDRLCSSGFISIGRGKSSASAIGKYIQDSTANSEDKVWSNTHKDKDGNQLAYSSYYDGIVKPSIYIFGTGSNKFKVGDSCTFEAYIGLYGTSTFEQRNDIDSRVAIYGRIEADTFANGDNPTGHFQMPYCPAPGESGSDPDSRPAETKFEIVQIIYYY